MKAELLQEGSTWILLKVIHAWKVCYYMSRVNGHRSLLGLEFVMFLVNRSVKHKQTFQRFRLLGTSNPANYPEAGRHSHPQERQSKRPLFDLTNLDKAAKPIETEAVGKHQINEKASQWQLRRGLGIGGIVGSVGRYIAAFWLDLSLIWFDLFRLTNVHCNMLVNLSDASPAWNALRQTSSDFRKDVPPYMIDRITMPSWQTWSKVGVIEKTQMISFFPSVCW